MEVADWIELQGHEPKVGGRILIPWERTIPFIAAVSDCWNNDYEPGKENSEAHEAQSCSKRQLPNP